MHCEPQPNPGGVKPTTVTVSLDRVMAVAERANGPQTCSFEQAVDLTCEDISAALKQPGQLYLVPKMMGRLGSLVVLAANVPADIQPETLPANSEQVPDAGDEFEAVVSTDPEAAGKIKADLPVLRGALSRDAFLKELHTETAWLPETIANARSHTLKIISKVVVDGVTEARASIANTPRLAAKLTRSWDLAFGRGARAQETRRNNQVVAAKAVAKERALHPVPTPGAQPPAPPAGPPADPAKK